jgi:LCP family protein required for cell wall assembly
VSEPGRTRKVTPFGPVLRGGRPRDGGPDWRLLGIVTTSIVMTIGLAVSATAGALLWTGQRAINRTAIAGLASGEDLNGNGIVDGPEIVEVDEVLNILVVGSDSREGLSKEQLKALGTEVEGGDRTDTIILARLDPTQDKAALLSFPRDLLVRRCDGSRGRINDAYQLGVQEGIGGPDCLVETVTELTGIPIDHFVRINLAGFIGVVDAVGGVSFYLDQPIRDRYAGVDLPAGCVTLNGAQAIGFVRARHIDSDFGRIARQQRFIRELVREATSLSTVLQPHRMFEVVRSIGQTLETDQRFGLSEMRRVAYTFRELTVNDVSAWTVPSNDSTRGGAYYAEMRPDEAEALFTSFRTGRFPPAGAPVPPRPALRPADVPPLQVQNGSGIDGIATSAQQALIDRGFNVVWTGNAPEFGHTETEVVFPPDREHEAQLVADALGGVQMSEGALGTVITVVVGRDFDASELPAAPAPGAPPAPPTPAAQPVAAPVVTPTPSEFSGATESTIQCGHA